MNKQPRRRFLIQIGTAGAAWALASPALRSAPSDVTKSNSDLAHHAAAERMSRYNVVWNSPSKDATGVMPIGNGDIAAGVYAIEDGDLYLLLAKNDAYNYMGDLYKTGRVRVSLDPNPFKAGKAFRQTLDLPSGSILIEADGVTLRIWADANRPVYHVEINSPREIAVTARPEFWKRFDACVSNVTNFYSPSSGLPPGAEPTQDVRLERDGKLLWYFAVGDRSVFADDLKFYDVEPMAAKFPDPFRFNTFGNLLESPALKLEDGALRGTGKSFDIRIHALAMQTPKAETWIETIERQAARPVDAARDWEKHRAWWASFWNRSWIVTSDRTLPPEAREQFDGEPSRDGPPRGKGWRGAGRTELQCFSLPDGLSESRACSDQVQRRTLHPAVAGASDGQDQAPRRVAASGRHAAHPRGRPALGPAFYLPEPAAALLAAPGQR